MNSERTLVVHCIDWPVTAAGFSPEHPVVVVRANRVQACSAAARGSGITIGLRRREAQRRNPDVEVVQCDPARDARVFEPIVNSIVDRAPLVDVLEPGICMMPTLGPSKYFGGDHALEVEISKAVRLPARQLGAVYQIGIADSPFAARLAARTSMIVPPGETPDFLAPFPLDVLEKPELTTLLHRLGLHTLGDFAALEEQTVMARFGPDGVMQQRLARGNDPHVLQAKPAPPELIMTHRFEDPVERIDIAAFAGRSLAVKLLNKLEELSLSCARVTIEVETEHRENISRCWRFDGVCTERTLSERVRWQLEGWLSGAVGYTKPNSGITTLRLVPDQLRPVGGEQHDLWNVTSEKDERAARGVARLQALAGPDTVQIVTLSDGRHPSEQQIFTAWGEHVDDLPPRPWPNQLPKPSPSLVHQPQIPVELLDESGAQVVVTKRGSITRDPRMLRSQKQTERIVAWAGPWTSDDQWWDVEQRKRRAFLQIVTESGSAHLITATGGTWLLDATYD